MKKFVRQNEIEIVQMDNEWMVLNPNSFMVTKLNEMGGLCLTMMEEPLTINAVVDALYARYEAPKDVIQQDVQSFVSDMMESGLIKNAS